MPSNWSIICSVSGISDSSFAAFRDARIDEHTGANSTPLYGVRSATESTHVVWGTIGGADVRFTKVDGYGAPLSGAVFTLYTDAACTSGHEVTVTPADGSTAVTSGTDGIVAFRAPVGIYYMKETTTPGGYQENTNTYIVLVGSGSVTKPDSTPDEGVWSENGVLYGLTQDDINAQRGTPARPSRHPILPGTAL